MKLTWTLVAPVLALAGAQGTPICVPPTRPTVPTDDAIFREYADLIADDFELYFNQISDFTTCLIEARRAVIEEGRAVGLDYRTFISRASALGIADRIGMTADPLVSENP
ncbi:hypothetical protein [uncultured Brevundimonas sp.]|uniref:hypothetical protein n=1 Tax=uncultured Brevundimonas sp. TaxID=213418 RepID=UPI00262AECC2|nr:hypothetical protein [uncultured Brevundimonas sp.]